MTNNTTGNETGLNSIANDTDNSLSYDSTQLEDDLIVRLKVLIFERNYPQTGSIFLLK